MTQAGNTYLNFFRKGINSDAVIEEHARITTVKTRIIKGHEHLLRIDEETTNPISTQALITSKSKSLINFNAER